MSCTVAELGRRMSAAEFGRWLAFFEAEDAGPKAERRQWAAMMAALHNGPLTKKTKKFWTTGEFLPQAQVGPPVGPKPATGADARAHIAAQKAAKQAAEQAAAKRTPKR